VPYLAVNHARAQVFAPYREVDPWAGMARPAAAVDATGVMGADTAPEPSGVLGSAPGVLGSAPGVLGSSPPLAVPEPVAPAPGAPFGPPAAGVPQGEPAFIPGFGVPPTPPPASPPVPAPASPPIPAPTTPPDPTVA
jgi:cleavage and polyadenylation specificity factor subunit 6/7